MKTLHKKLKMEKTAKQIETPVRSAEEILQKHRAKDDSLPHWVTNKHAIEAMKEYASQFKPSVVGEKEEQRFTIEEAEKEIAYLRDELIRGYGWKDERRP